MEEKKLRKDIDLDGIEMGDDVFPEEKFLGKLKLFDEKTRKNKEP